MQINQIGQLTELQAIGGGYFTEAYPTNFHHKYTRKPLLAGESASDYKDVTEAEWAAIEAEDAKWFKPDALTIDLYNNLFGDYGSYNPDTGFFEAYGLKDVTTEQAKEAIAIGPIPSTSLRGYCPSRLARVVAPSNPAAGLTIPGFLAMFYASNLERWGGSKLMFDNTTQQLFCWCSKLTHLQMEICLYADSCLDHSFKGAYKLQEVRFTNIKGTCTFKDSPKLSLASFSHMVENANPGGATLQVHPDVYAKVTGDYTNEAAAALTAKERAQWLALSEMATAKNIIFTTQT